MKLWKWTLLVGALSALTLPVAFTQSATEAPPAFVDNPAEGVPTLVSNGFTTPDVFAEDLEIFNAREEADEGLGPLYNSDSCGQCHSNPVIGGVSTVSELRAGHFDGINFVDHPGGSLINERAINPKIQERVQAGNEVRTFRMTTNTLGDGFVEAIDSNTLVAIMNAQPAGQRGTFIQVPVGEAGNALRGGRFGWKNQNSSLLSFSADAYLNEMGITSPLQPNENTSNGNSVAAFDEVPDPEEPPSAEFPQGEDVERFARFMRATGVPPRDSSVVNNPNVVAGSNLFNAVGCAVCHTRTIVTSPAGTVINQGAFTVPPALGNKIIHPFSDYLLHNVGTGDGIVQNGGQGTRNQLRTAALWGMRSRPRLMHDGLTVNRNESILRHAGQATASVNAYNTLSNAQKAQLIAFLDSL